MIESQVKGAWAAASGWIRRAWRVFAVAPRHVWVTLGVIAAAYAAGLVVAGTPANHARIAGALLQTLGLGTVAMGLRNLRKIFGREPFSSLVSGWLRDVIGLFRRPQRQGVNVSATSGGQVEARSSAEAIVAPGPDAPLERRVEILEAKLENLRAKLDQTVQDFSKRLARVRDDVRQERMERVENVTTVEKKFEEVSIGGIHLEMMGLTWLLVGVLLGTLPIQALPLCCLGLGREILSVAATTLLGVP
jgi:hypothetical protein